MVRCCVEVHYVTVLGNKYWSSFLHNVVAIANNRNDNGAISTEMEIKLQKNRKNSELHITRIELTTLGSKSNYIKLHTSQSEPYIIKNVIIELIARAMIVTS